MTRLLIPASGLVTLLLFAGCGAQAEEVSVEATAAGQENLAGQEAEVREVVQSIEDAINGRDWPAFGSHFSQAADAMLFDSRSAVGPEAVASLMSEVLASTPPDVKADLSPEHVRFLGPDVALANVNATFEGSQPSEDRAIFVLRRDGVRWFIEAFRVFPAQG